MHAQCSYLTHLKYQLIFFSVILAVSIPQLGLFISLFGALCLSALGIIFPALMEICVSFPKNFGPGHVKLVKDIVLLIIGVIGLLAGTYATLLEIVHTFIPKPIQDAVIDNSTQKMY